MVGAVRFELTTSCTRNKRASQTTLRPDPINDKNYYAQLKITLRLLLQHSPLLIVKQKHFSSILPQRLQRTSHFVANRIYEY